MSKQNQFNEFVHSMYAKIYKDFVFSHDSPKEYKLQGERKEMAVHSLQVLNKYKKKFFDIRGGDIDALFAEKYDRITCSSSYVKHMRPSMLKEFENAYRQVSNLLKVNVFQFTELPIIKADGSVKYKEDKPKEKEEKEEKNIEKEVKEVKPKERKDNDEWSDEDEPRGKTKVSVSKDINGEIVKTIIYI
jgi:hypothetical protein